jgi:hypothetical protein
MCNIYGLYSDNDSAKNLHLLNHQTDYHIPIHLIQDICKDDSIHKFIPFKERQNFQKLNRCPDFRGKLTLFFDNKPIEPYQLVHNQEINFQFDHKNFSLSQFNNYGIENERVISTKILTKDESSLPYIVSTTNKNKKYYFYFFPNLINSYDLDSTCPIQVLHPTLQKIWDRVKALNKRFREVSLQEGSSSCTLGKKKIIIRIKDEKGNLYEENTIYNVLLHELAHVLCDEHGHTTKFWNIMDELIDLAHHHKIFDKNIPMNKNYYH